MTAVPTTSDNDIYILISTLPSAKPPMTTPSSAVEPPHPNHRLLFSTAPRWPSSRRISNNPSHSSSPTSPNSLISSSDTASPPPPSPAAASQVGIPFSWEDLPGIPKKEAQQLLRKSTRPDTRYTSTRATHLPPPPAGPKGGGAEGGGRDPFMAALLECSRDGGGDRQGRVWKKVGRSVSERFSMTPISIHQFSCKRSCAVSDSVVFLPRPRRALSYDIINNASG